MKVEWHVIPKGDIRTIMREMQYAAQCLEYQLRETDKENPPRDLIEEAFYRDTGYGDVLSQVVLTADAFFFCDCGVVVHRITRDA